MHDDGRVPDYLARITVQDVPDEDTRAGMADALGAVDDTSVEHAAAGDASDEAALPGSPVPGPVTFTVPGEAPDLETATLVAQRHAAELLDGFAFEVDVRER